MPLGWLLPNDGYGAGYGQTETLDGNIQNLKSLTDYAHKNGVEIGLWTQSDLHPKDSISALLQRDIVKEVRDAGVRVLKTDVAWVGWGYSFGLNGVADVGHIMPYYGNDARPFIISLSTVGPARSVMPESGRATDRRTMGIYPFPHPDLYRLRAFRTTEHHIRHGRYFRWQEPRDEYPRLPVEDLDADGAEHGRLGIE